MINISNFPIKIGDKDRLESYVDSLNNGERQLLITEGNRKNIYLTDGKGKCSDLGAELVRNYFDENSLGGNVDIKMNQISKMGIVASEEKPHIVSIPINTLDFNMPRVNVLKFEKGSQNIITVKNDFTNGESNDFEENEYIVFDGKAHLKTKYLQNYNLVQDNNEFTEYKITLDISNFKDVLNIDDFEDGVIQKIQITALPKDQILIPTGDIDLSNVENIDFFKLKANGKNIRIICSADSGQTWKTFKLNKWEDVEFNLGSIKSNGIDIDTFNKINDIYWNKLITSHKVRFAYLISLDDINDIEEIDELTIQFDGVGKWIQAKESNYDVIYASNKLLEVHIKFNGDIKINY